MSGRRELMDPQLSDSEEPAELVDEVDLIRVLVAEFLGAFFLVFVTLGVVYASAIVTFDTVSVGRLLMIALAYGLTYAACLYALSFPSSTKGVLPNTRHLNPAITFSLYISGNLGADGWFLFPLYVLSQLGGAGVGVLALYYCTPFDKRDVFTTYPLAEGVTVLNEWTMEIAISFISILTITMTSFGHLQRNNNLGHDLREEAPQTHHEINCIIAGAVIFVCAVVGGPVSGGYMNPVIALCIGILSDSFLLGPFIGPFAGGVLAVIVGHLFGFKIKWVQDLLSKKRRRRRK